MERNLKEKIQKKLKKDERVSRKRREWFLGTPKNKNQEII